MTGARTPGITAIIPARGGSKGIPGKNMLRVGDKPLIAHTIDAVLTSGVADRVIVSSDDERILGWAATRPGVEAIPRPAELAGDASTIAEMAQHLVVSLGLTGTVGVFQPTSPMRSSGSIADALGHYRAAGARSLMTVVRNQHLHWYAADGELADAEPLFAERTNRQFATWRLYQETGSIQLIEADALRAKADMVSDHHTLFELPAKESIDIDAVADLLFARQLERQGTIVFRLRANKTVGSGHLFHCLQLADELIGHHLRFLLVDCDPFVGELLEARGHVRMAETDLAENLKRLFVTPGSVIVNDVLDTTASEIALQHQLGHRVVTIEDLGPGHRMADWVVNALYPPSEGPTDNVVTGPAYATLRPEFSGLPDKVVRDTPERVLLTFGGTDPAGLGPRVAQLLAKHLTLPVRVIVGPGADPAGYPDGCDVVQTVPNMAAEMLAADLVITSAGRTVYEAAATGTPTIVLAQNAREATHVHLGYDQGVIFAGIGALVSDEQIVELAQRLLASPSLRAELSERLRAGVDHRGARRIAAGIEALLEGLR